MNMMTNLKTPAIIAKVFLLVGLLLCAQGLFVLLKLLNSISSSDRSIVIGLTLLMFGFYCLYLSDKQDMRQRIEALEKQHLKP
jgi:uncharacterized membrane protein